MQPVLLPKGYQIVVVGSTFFESDFDLINNLNSAGCLVIREYVPKIEEIYNSCDLYLFPVDTLHPSYFPKNYLEVGVIDMPLSVLEALACELPVICPEIETIQTLLADIPNPPVYFYDGTVKSFLKKLDKIPSTPSKHFAEIRILINKDKIFQQIERLYLELIKAFTL